jgi:hypothetical protein
MTGLGRRTAAGIGLGLVVVAGAAAAAAVVPGGHARHVAAPHERTAKIDYPMSWQSTVVAAPYVDYALGKHQLRYGTPVPTRSLTRHGEHVRSQRCAFTSCWAIGVTSEGYQYPLTRPAESRTWRIGGPWFAGAWAQDTATVASRIQILTPKAVIAFTLRDWAYLSTDEGQDWHLIGLGHVVTAAVEQGASGSATYRVTAQTTSSPVETRDYISTDGVVWRLASRQAP